MDAEKARAIRRHGEFGKLWAFVGGRGPSRIKVDVNADTAGVLEGFWSLVDYRMNKAPMNGKIKRAHRAGRKLKGWHSSSLST